jgi:hypothetical protein
MGRGRKTTRILNQDDQYVGCDLNPAPSDYKLGVGAPPERAETGQHSSCLGGRVTGSKAAGGM